MTYFSTGIYTLKQAQRLSGVSAPTIRRWVYGYHRKAQSGNAAENRFIQPLWKPQIPSKQFEVQVIGFLDLVEIRFVNEFVRHGVPLTVVRNCLARAKKLFNNDYPFTSGQFQTDGETIFVEALEETTRDDEGNLIDLKSGQYAFKKIILPSLFTDFNYKDNVADKWYQNGQKTVVLDPERKYGSPIIDKTGVPTDVLYSSYRAEGGNEFAIEQTARVYGIELDLVRDAINFEKKLDGYMH